MITLPSAELLDRRVELWETHFFTKLSADDPDEKEVKSKKSDRLIQMQKFSTAEAVQENFEAAMKLINSKKKNRELAPLIAASEEKKGDMVEEIKRKTAARKKKLEDDEKAERAARAAAALAAPLPAAAAEAPPC